MSLTAHQVVYIQIDGYNSDSGDVYFTIEGPPPNDNFVNAVPIDFNTTATALTADATHEPHETDAVPNGLGAHSVWFQFVPSSTDQYYIGTDESDFDTTLAVYTYTSGGITKAVKVRGKGGGGRGQLLLHEPPVVPSAFVVSRFSCCLSSLSHMKNTVFARRYAFRTARL